jgi:hypothetical protein
MLLLTSTFFNILPASFQHPSNILPKSFQNPSNIIPAEGMKQQKANRLLPSSSSEDITPTVQGHDDAEEEFHDA